MPTRALPQIDRSQIAERVVTDRQAGAPLVDTVVRHMPLLFLIFGLLSVALLVTLIGSIVIGLLLQRTQRFKTFGVFVALVAPLASLGAGLLSWGLSFWAVSMADGTNDLKTSERW